MPLEVNRMYRQFITAVCVLLNIQVHRAGRNTLSISNGIIFFPMLFRTAINIQDVANSVRIIKFCQEMHTKQLYI